jgi:hypothetical protein
VGFDEHSFRDILNSNGIFSEHLILKSNGLLEFKPNSKYDYAYIDEISKWIDDSLLYISKREEFEKENPMVLTLFRFLGMNHRLLKPMSDKEIKIDERLLNKLHRAICDKSLEYFFLPKEIIN